MRFALVVPAAGIGKRLKSKMPKALVTFAGKPLLVHTLRAMRRAYAFAETVVAVDPSLTERVDVLLKKHGLNKVRVVAGGRTRAESVFRALGFIRSEAVLVHDAARPFADRRIVADAVRSVTRHGSALTAVPATSTVKRTDRRGEAVVRTEDRRTLYLAQTPQGFRTKDLLARYRALGRTAFAATDEAQLFDGTRLKVRIVPGSARNIKITTPEDLKLAEYLIKQ